MNQVEESIQTHKCNQNDAVSNKNKAKESTETYEISIAKHDNLNDIAKSVNVNNINSNLTNGTSEHACEHNSSSENDSHYAEEKEARSQETLAERLDLQSVRYLVEEALERLESLNLREKPATQDEIEIVSYESELQMPEIMRLIQKDLSEPYSIYTYRYFIHNWPKLCFLARHEGTCIGAIVCKLDLHQNSVKRGYIAMLAVDEGYRKKKIGSRLVRKAIQAMINDNADEVVLETEITNKPALKLYENLGFVRDKRLFRYYLNGVDALRLKLWLR